MEFRGIPLHPLVVHAVVVLLPLTALAAILVSLWPAARRKLTFLVPLGALVTVVSTAVAIAAGKDLAQKYNGAAAVQAHGELGEGVLWWSIGLLVLTAAQYAYFRVENRRRWLTLVLAALVVLASVGGIVQVSLAGDAGAHLVWSNG